VAIGKCARFGGYERGRRPISPEATTTDLRSLARRCQDLAEKTAQFDQAIRLSLARRGG
jgi:hypothetical protein